MSPEGRYDRHPLLSQYTSEKLAEYPEERAEVEKKHGTYYLALVRESEPDTWTLKRKETFRTFLLELANVRAAWDWAARTMRVDEIARTTPAMFEFFRIRLTEGLEHFGTTFEFFGTIAEHLDETNPSHAGALGTLLVHQVLDSLYTQVPDYPRARPLAERGIELLEQVGDYRSLSRGFTALGETYMLGEFSQAEEYYRQALDLAREHGTASDIYHALYGVRRVEGRLLELTGEDEEAWSDRANLEDLEEYRALNHLPGVIEKHCTHGTGWNPGEHAAILKSYRRREKNWRDQVYAWFEQETIDLERGHEYAAYIMHAMSGGEPFQFNGNVPNRNLISNLPDGACVEVPVWASAKGLEAVAVGPLPASVAPLTNIYSQIEEMAVAATLNGDRRLIYQAVAYSPLSAAVLSLAEIRELVDELFAANEPYLPPQFAAGKVQA